MKNWSTDTKQLQKDPRKFAIWKLEQMINFGLDGEKISEAELKEYWNELNIDPARRKFLSLLIYGRNTDSKTN